MILPHFTDFYLPEMQTEDRMTHQKTVRVYE